MTKEKRQFSESELQDFIRENMPAMREVAPKEFDAMVKNGEILAEKLMAYMHGAVKGREDVQFALVAFIAPEVTIEVGAVVAGVVAGEIAGSKSKIARASRGPGHED
jgi:hypothetical protein